jgi:type VI secretion system secreted protein VgrG
VCFRPPFLGKPQIAGTVPARVTSNKDDPVYSRLDDLGRYRVSFLFDRDSWEKGRESMWLRLARPYAGATHGLHLPLIAGTEVAIAFEQGDPDRPYIAHALHDNKHQDHVTVDNQQRNVLRTPANNKLRMDDTRGKEHVKLSTDYGGKSQLNLGYMTGVKKNGVYQKRGDGFELRSDSWGVVRAGKGMLLTAYEQPKAGGAALVMDPLNSLIQGAAQQLTDWRTLADAHHSRPPAIAGLEQLQANAKDLTAPAILLGAPQGIAAVTPASLLLRSGDSLYVQSQAEINLAAGERLSVHSNRALSLLAQEEGMRLVSGKGPLEIESHGDQLKLIAQQDMTLQTVQGHLQVTAKNGITLGCGGGFIRIKPDGGIDIHSPGLINYKGEHRFDVAAGEQFALPELPSSVCVDCLNRARKAAEVFASRESQV